MNLFPGMKAKAPEVLLKASCKDPSALPQSAAILHRIFDGVAPGRELVIVCVGTDRSTGDSLGPLVGTFLRQKASADVALYGTIDDPVHAVNLQETMDRIALAHRQPFVVAIDACLGQVSSVGCIQIGDGPVRPGAGVQKQLPPVGDIHITGIVNVGGFMEYFVLQNTRLSLVMQMAELISGAILQALLTSRRIYA